ncbi:MAG: SCP2 sterol-binding domain-containing protein [Velocimicrobium sp.]
MKINIYYGGRGLIEDPTIYVMNKITEVLKDLRVEVTRYNLYEDKQGISTLSRTIKECDGVILAVNLEWMGIGGLMQSFLDACWLYADKAKISSLYMLPIVMSSTYGERDAQFTLIKAWEILGGIPLDGLCAYVDNHAQFETNPEYSFLIEKKAEQLYRTINQKSMSFPSSTNAVKQTIMNHNIDLTPQESEQLSVYVSDDTYVKKQKEDIEELTQIFKEMLGTSDDTSGQEFIEEFSNHFHPLDDFCASYTIQLADANKTLVIEVNNSDLKCKYGQKEDADVAAKTSHETLSNIINGHMTFQRAFMSGSLTAKGNFKTLRTFDTLFQFTN